jgi:hypothetical protein
MTAIDAPIKLDVDADTLAIGREAARGVLFGGVPIEELSYDELLAAAGFLHIELKDLQTRTMAAVETLLGPELQDELAAGG